MIIYLVASLPRSGTTSLCKMGDICGLKTKHTLKGSKFRELINDGYSLFSDTPFYSPEFLVGLIETYPNINDLRLIYSHRSEDSWRASFKKLIKIFKVKDLNGLYKVYLHDKLCYDYINSLNSFNGFDTHYEMIKELSKVYKIPLLDYNFSEGWGPFCDFLNVDIPKQELPHLNKSN